LGLPGLLLSVLKAQPESTPVGGQKSIIQLTDADYDLYKSLEEVITVESSLEEGFVSLSVTDSDPMIAAQVAKATEVALQQRIINYKIESSKALYEFVSSQYLDKQKELYSTQNKLAYYKDRSRNFFTAQISVEGQRLESEFGVANAVYLELAKQKEQASIQLKKEVDRLRFWYDRRLSSYHTIISIHMFIYSYYYYLVTPCENYCQQLIV
jgi:uncharacterized protein involved in exopolysaccharide biosynthesis